MSGAGFGTLGAVLPAEVANLLGDLLLLFGLGMYARHVILHAQGLLPSKKRRNNKDKLGRDAKSPTASAGQTAGNGNHRAGLQPHASFRRTGDEDSEEPEPEEQPVARARIERQGTAQPSNSATPPAVRPSSDAANRSGGASPDEADESDDHNRKLSKAEGKRLRKLRAQQEQGW